MVWILAALGAVFWNFTPWGGAGRGVNFCDFELSRTILNQKYQNFLKGIKFYLSWHQQAVHPKYIYFTCLVPLYVKAFSHIKSSPVQYPDVVKSKHLNIWKPSNLTFLASVFIFFRCVTAVHNIRTYRKKTRILILFSVFGAICMFFTIQPNTVCYV